MSIQDELIKTIEMMVKRAISTQQNMDIASTVTKVNGTTCSVIIDGQTYEAKNGNGLSLSPGTGVWLHKMNGSINDLYILCKR